MDLNIEYKTSIKEIIKKIKEGKELVIPGSEDAVFKTLLENCHGFLALIIEEITGIPYDVVLDTLEVKNTELPIDQYEEKRKRSDLIIEIEKGTIILEMNREYYDGLLQKNLSYLEKINVQEVKRGEPYKGENRKHILINLDVDLNKSFPEAYQKKEKLVFELQERTHHFPYGVSLQIYHISLFNIFHKYYNKDSKELTRFIKSMLFLVTSNKHKLEELSKGEKDMEEAKRCLESLSANEPIISAYEYELLDRFEERAKAAYREKVAQEKAEKAVQKKEQAVQKKEQAIQEKEEAIQEKEQIIQEKEQVIQKKEQVIQEKEQAVEQREKAMEEKMEKATKDIVQNMLKDKLDINAIMRYTHLSKEEINTIKETM